MNMEQQQRKIWIGVGIAVVVAGLLVSLYFIFRKEKESGETQVQVKVWNRAQATQTMHQLCLFADSMGIDTMRYQLTESTSQKEADTKFAQLLLELRYGIKPGYISYSKLPEKVDTAWAINMLSREDKPLEALSLLEKQPAFGPYTALLAQFHQVRGRLAPDSLKAIQKTLNFYRYLNRFDYDKFVVVNIPAAELNVYDHTGKRMMPMEVIVGKKDHETPCFTTYLTDVTAYPYWNVPQGIAVKELLPKIQANLSFIDNQNLEVLDARNQIIDPETIDWASMSATNFPYRIRQTSGCHNSLGLIKFNLTGPGAIYLHDTNARGLFTATNDRWRSHGCVRLEKPVEFANFVLEEPKFDEGFYNRCLIDQKPTIFKLPRPFPVFVVYNLADVNEAGQLQFFRDVYALVK